MPMEKATPNTIVPANSLSRTCGSSGAMVRVTKNHGRGNAPASSTVTYQCRR